MKAVNENKTCSAPGSGSFLQVLPLSGKQRILSLFLSTCKYGAL